MKLQLSSQVFIELMLCLVFFVTCNAQIKIHNQSNLTKKQQVIIRALFPDNTPDERSLKKFNRKEVVAALKIVRRNTYRREAAIYAYLLAYLHENYSENKARLLEIVGSCTKYKPTDPDYECDEAAAEYLHKLYLKGDSSIIHPLFRFAKRSDSALSETLGSNYAETITKNSILFLTTLKTFKLTDQKHIIDFTIRQDGSCSPECLPQVKL